MATKATNRQAQLYTEEKAVHLVRVFISILSVMLLLGWLQLILLHPLKRGRADMVRKVTHGLFHSFVH